MENVSADTYRETVGVIELITREISNPSTTKEETTKNANHFLAKLESITTKSGFAKSQGAEAVKFLKEKFEVYYREEYK